MLYLTRKQVREVDRRSIEEYGIPGIVLMENAARAATDAALRMLPQPPSANVLILCGGGNNGGDGLAIARHLHNAQCAIQLALTTDPGRYTGDAAINWRITQTMRLPAAPCTTEIIAGKPWDLIIDAIFGTGLDQAPRQPFGQIAAAINASRRPILAIDLPSGLDCDTGAPLGPCIRATRTITFVAEKSGFANPAASEYLGIVEVGGIGSPRELTQIVRQEDTDASCG